MFILLRQQNSFNGFPQPEIDHIIKNRLICAKLQKLVCFDDFPNGQKKRSLRVFAHIGQPLRIGRVQMFAQHKRIVAAVTDILLKIIERISQIDIPPKQIAESFQYAPLAAVMRKQAADL